MAGCVFHANGRDFAVTDFLADSPLEPYDVHHRGEPRFRRDMQWEKSGFKVNVSNEDWRLDKQCADATAFLRNFEVALQRLKAFSGVEDCRLDFAYQRRPVMVQSDYLPPELLRLAGSLGIGIELSLYPSAQDQDGA
jgi:hypothetical protein